MWNIEYLLTELKVISQIPTNGRLCISNGMLSVETYVFWLPLKRWILMDNRYTVIMHIKQLFVDLELFMKHNKTDIEEWILQELISMFENVKQGLSNLKLTYSDDAQTTAHIDMILAKFENILTKYANKKK